MYRQILDSVAPFGTVRFRPTSCPFDLERFYSFYISVPERPFVYSRSVSRNVEKIIIAKGFYYLSGLISLISIKVPA